MSLYRCTKCQNVDNGEITYPHGQHLLSLGKQVDWHCTICLGKPWHNRFPIEKYLANRHVVLNPPTAFRQLKYTITVAAFLAPGHWRGFFNQAGTTPPGGYGDISDPYLDGIILRDLNVSNDDLLGPLYFQLGLFNKTPHNKITKIDIEGLGTLTYDTQMQHNKVNRSFFTDGHTNLFNWFDTRVGQKVSMTLWANEL